MNISSTSSFLGYGDATSSAGNVNFFGSINQIIFFDGGNVIIPNQNTILAIRESQDSDSNRFADVNELLGDLND